MRKRKKESTFILSSFESLTHSKTALANQSGQKRYKTALMPFSWPHSNLSVHSFSSSSSSSTQQTSSFVKMKFFVSARIIIANHKPQSGRYFQPKKIHFSIFRLSSPLSSRWPLLAVFSVASASATVVAASSSVADRSSSPDLPHCPAHLDSSPPHLEFSSNRSLCQVKGENF